MYFRTVIAILALVAAATAQSDPVGKVLRVSSVAACSAQADAVAVMDVIADDIDYGQQLFASLAREKRCGSYTGVFTVDKVIRHEDQYWVLKITTLKDGELYLIYMEPEEESVETA